MKVYCPLLLSGKYFANKHASKGLPGGQNVSPLIQWGDVPHGVGSFALSMIDRLSSSKEWVHWYVINIPASFREIPERASGNRDKMPRGSLELRNSFGDLGYGGPEPPKNSPSLVCEITVHALNVAALPVGPFSTPEECAEEMRGRLIGGATMTAIFRR